MVSLWQIIICCCDTNPERILMTTISAKTILRSRNAAAPDKVLSTLLLRYPRSIHAEFMTHRVFSRNAASSRAIPVSKLIQDVLDDPFVPLVWGKNQRGMQAGAEHDARVQIWKKTAHFGHVPEMMTNADAWLKARDAAVEAAQAFDAAGYHKQIVNRLLEPFAHITVVVSSTEWSNFLALRDHADAEPHIAMLAREIRRCLDDDPVQTLIPCEWHLPFISKDDITQIAQPHKDLDDWQEYARRANVDAIKLSVARCASTSYKTVDGFDMTLDRAFALHDKLVAAQPLHASPCEHVAQADIRHVFGSKVRDSMWANAGQHGNFTGFRQYRKMLPGECL